MAKTANLYARIEPELKIQAESILDSLGVSASNAITMFYKQIVLQNGLPFEVKLPSRPVDISKLTEAQLDAELSRGYEQFLADDTMNVAEAFSDLYKEYNK